MQSTETGTPVFPGVFFAGGPIVTPGEQGVIGVCFAGGASSVDGRNVTGSAYTAIACATNNSDYSEVFAISGTDKGVYYLQPAATAGQFTPVKLSGTTQIAAIAANTMAQGQLEVFAVGTDSLLYYVRQDSTAPNGWTDLLGLDAEVRFARIAVLKNAEAFATTTSSDLYHIYHDPQTTDWTIEQVELSTRGDLEQFSSYTVQLTTYDANQLPTANTQVTISCYEPVTLNINGQTCFVDASRPWEGVSNIGGQIAISGKTEALAVPPLSVWTSAMPTTDRIAIDPSGPIRAQLSAVDDAGQALLNAQTASSNGTQYSTTQLVQGSTNRNPNVVASVAQGVKAAMSLGTTQPGGPAAAGVGLHPRTDPRVARYLANYDGISPNRINLAAVPEQHWQIDFTSGTPVFRTLTAARSAVLVAEQQRLPNVSSFLGLDWGAVFSAIVNGVAGVASVVVDAVSNAISATITLIIKGAQYVYNATISLVEQTLDLAQEIFAQIQVGFEQLFGWLGYIFNWSDILRTHEALVYLVNQSAAFGVGVLSSTKAQILAGLTSVESQFQQYAEQFINSVLPTGVTTGAEQQSSVSGPSSGAYGTDQRNVFMTAFQNNAGATTMASTTKGYNLPIGVQQAVSSIISELQGYAAQFQSVDAFARAVSYFQQIGESPDQFFQLALAGLLEIGEGIALAAFDIVKTGLGLLFDLLITLLNGMSAMLNDAWDIPLVSDLYKWLTGSTLTALDVYSLLIAIPTTIVFKVTENAAPFPDDASLSAFEQAYSAQQLLAGCGFSRSGAAARAAPLRAVGETSLGQRLVKVVVGLNFMAFGFLEGLVDVQPPLPVSGGQENQAIIDPLSKALYFQPLQVAGKWIPNPTIGVLAKVTWIAELSAQVLANPLFLSEQPTNWSCLSGPGALNIVWAMQWFEPVVDLAGLYESNMLMRSLGDPGAIVSTCWGGLHLVMGLFANGLNGWKDVAGTIALALSTLPEMGKVLRVEDLAVESVGASLLGLLLIDWVFNIGSGAFMIGW